MPTKSPAHHAETGSGHGEAVERTRKLTTALRDSNFTTLDTIDAVTVFTGRAAFVDAKTVEITAGDDRLTITGDTIVINTGAEPVLPGIPGITSSTGVFTSAARTAASTARRGWPSSAADTPGSSSRGSSRSSAAR